MTRWLQPALGGVLGSLIAWASATGGDTLLHLATPVLRWLEVGLHATHDPGCATGPLITVGRRDLYVPADARLFEVEP